MPWVVSFRARPGLYSQRFSQGCKSACVCVNTGVEILRHVTAGGPMPMRKDGAEKEMTVAMAMPSWSGWWLGSVKLLPAETMRAAKKQWKSFTFIIIIMRSGVQKYAWWLRHVPSPNNSLLRCFGTYAFPPPTILQIGILLQVALKTISLFPFEQAIISIRATDSFLFRFFRSVIQSTSAKMTMGFFIILVQSSFTCHERVIHLRLLQLNFTGVRS